VKFKIIFTGLLLLSIVVFSALYSGRVYRFYMKTWYTVIKRETVSDAAEKIKKLYDEKEFSVLQDYMDSLMLIYPGNSKIMRLCGMTYVKLDRKKRGAELIVASLNGDKIKDDELQGIIDFLFDQELYGDITGIFKLYDPGSSHMHYIYGISLFKIGRFNESIGELIKAGKGGEAGSELHYYLGLSYERTGAIKNAIREMERARSLNVRDIKINHALVGLYRKTGQYAKASAIMRPVKR